MGIDYCIKITKEDLEDFYSSKVFNDIDINYEAEKLLEEAYDILFDIGDIKLGISIGLHLAMGKKIKDILFI